MGKVELGSETYRNRLAPNPQLTNPKNPSTVFPRPSKLEISSASLTGSHENRMRYRADTSSG
jgi:hypothetical protein